MSSDDAAKAVNPIADWFGTWAEQQRKWMETTSKAATMPAAADAAGAAKNPFLAVAEAMTAWVTQGPAGGALPTPLGMASWQALPSMSEALGRVNDGPMLAPLWDFDRKSAAAAAAWWKLQQVNMQYRMLVDGVWPKVQLAVLNRTTAEADAGKKPGAKDFNPRATTDLWLDELNKCLLELMRTQEYVSAQHETLDAGLTLREKMGEIAEDVCEWMQLPARSEVDDLALTVTELRRELRALQRSVRSVAAPVAAAAAAEAKPAVKAAGKAARKTPVRRKAGEK